jgi:cytochrome P450
VGALPVPELVTAFGHGRHTCPAQPFSLAAMTRATTCLLDRFDLESAWADHPDPVRAQIGGVARAARACPVGYQLRARSA